MLPTFAVALELVSVVAVEAAVTAMVVVLEALALE
jgi:hypothetical protein